MEEQIKLQIENYSKRQVELEKEIDALQARVANAQAEHLANQGALKALQSLISTDEVK